MATSYSDPFVDSDKYAEDQQIDHDNDTDIIAADASIYHNNFNGYKDGQLAALRLQLQRMRDYVDIIHAREQAMIVYIDTLQNP